MNDLVTDAVTQRDASAFVAGVMARAPNAGGLDPQPGAGRWRAAACSRRAVVRLMSAAAAAPLLASRATPPDASACGAEASTERAADDVDAPGGAGEEVGHEARQAASLLRSECGPFLRAIRPVSRGALLWRGHGSSVHKLTAVQPAPDLMDDATYGAEGAAFFRLLDGCLLARSALDVRVPRPARSHVGTGSPAAAAAWGAPLTVWPRFEFRYAVWSKGALFYAPGDSLLSAFRQRRPLLFGDGGGDGDGDHLREALLQGREVLFQCPSFYILPAALLPDVLTLL